MKDLHSWGDFIIHPQNTHIHPAKQNENVVCQIFGFSALMFDYEATISVENAFEKDGKPFF